MTGLPELPPGMRWDVVLHDDDGNFPDPDLKQYMTSLIDRYRNGDNFALLQAISLALSRNAGCLLPDDMLGQFRSGLAMYDCGNARTLDEAFNVARPKGWHQQTHKDWQRSQQVFIWVQQARLGSKSINEAILKVAKRIGFCKTKTEEMYYSWKKVVDAARRSRKKTKITGIQD
ncbi:hypothetical protein [uncultured Thiohalocapsa sp.]|uniref:hypothetical protein n=1 Tax=uncultured Thiohalocapsa sp. TaxID=768990 RepID=UPI0025F3B0F0|nr:hypothetical protein [uncultured Thiohalocapsa sp.]